jgi:mRNA-degrading endonuclease toxin of MazEF toxin-antitoxin module
MMKKMATTTPRRGEVWLVDLGMVAKIRPCLVVSIPANSRHLSHTQPARGDPGSKLRSHRDS